MTTISGSLPTVGNNNSTEDPVTRSLLSEIKSAHNTDHAAGAHPLSWLAAGAAGQLIVGTTGTGVATWTTVSGDVTIDGGGITAIGAGKVTNAMLAGSITAANLAGSIPDTKLSSPNNSTYKTLLVGAVAFPEAIGAGTYQFNGTSAAPLASGTGMNLPTFAGYPQPFIYFVNADYSVGSLTQKLRIRAQAAVNTTGPGVTFTVGMYPITVAGGAKILTFTLGTVVPGSTVAFASPSSSTVGQNNSGDFTIPADGAYALGVVTNGTTATNSATLISAQLQTRNT